MSNIYYVVLRFGIFHSVKRCNVGTVPRGGEPYNVARDRMQEQYPTAAMVGFFGREDYAETRAEKLNSLTLTKI